MTEWCSGEKDDTAVSSLGSMIMPLSQAAQEEQRPCLYVLGLQGQADV